jgi:hypothetical protein
VAKKRLFRVGSNLGFYKKADPENTGVNSVIPYVEPENSYVKPFL